MIKKKMVLGLVFPVEEEEKINPNHKQIAYFWQATLNYALSYCLPVSSLCMDQNRNGEGEGKCISVLKKKKKNQDEQTKRTDLEIL